MGGAIGADTGVNQQSGPVTGGCSCTTSPGGRPSGAVLFVGLGLVLVWRRRRSPGSQGDSIQG
jgi:MYXO-CTERM domain-containing protein